MVVRIIDSGIRLDCISILLKASKHFALFGENFDGGETLGIL